MTNSHLTLTFVALSAGIGPAFGGTAPTCPSDSHWVRAHHRRAYVKVDGTHVSASDITAHCQKNPPGYSFWKDRIKNGAPPSWPLKEEKPSRWREQETEQTLDALSTLPEVLFSRSIQGIYRMQKSRDYPNPATSASGVIVLYDNAFESKQNLSRILGHELAHEHFRNLGEEETEDFQIAMNWFSPEKNGKSPNWITRGRQAFVEDDGLVSPAEDFANNVEYYLFRRDTLRKVTPNADAWISKHFGPSFKLENGKR